MDRLFLIIIFLLLLGYLLGIVFSSKPISFLARILKKPKKYLSKIGIVFFKWNDWLFILSISSVVIIFLLYGGKQLKLENTIQILIVIGTFASVLFSTLIKDNASKHRGKAEIDIKFNFSEPDCHQTVTNTGIPNTAYACIPTYYIRLRVINKGGETLKRTEVILERVKKNNVLMKTYLPLNLIWALTEVQFNRGVVEIPQGMFRTLDIFKILEPTQTMQLSNTLQSLDQSQVGVLTKKFQALSGGIGICSVVEPNTISDVLPLGNYYFYLSVCADNTKPFFIKMSVKYDGKWDAELKTMFTKHLKARLVSVGQDRNEVFD